MANYKNTKQASNIGAAVTREEVEMLVKDLHNVRKFYEKTVSPGRYKP